MTGAELKRRRKRMRLGPVELARLLGVSYNAVWHWENNKRPIPEMAVKLLDCLEKTNGRPALET